MLAALRSRPPSVSCSRFVHSLFEEPSFILWPGPTTAARVYEFAALSHLCSTLRRVDDARRSGDDLALRLLARHHWETYVVCMDLHFHGEQALTELIGWWKGGNAEGRRRRTEPRPCGLFSDVSLLGRRIDRHAELERGLLAGVKEHKYSYADAASRVDKRLKASGESFRAEMRLSYAVIYRGLSTLGVHSNLGTISEYVDDSGNLVHILPAPPSERTLAGAAHGAWFFTLMAAYVVTRERAPATGQALLAKLTAEDNRARAQQPGATPP